ncbi:nucleotidyl transferase AbiEii/AbiGii toxin family protein [Nocardioides sp. NPDC057577]|uniref:nucleotidyl transferase AbiEii/AbiGii toxin family protein n=1 Tax=Nocardioides sp. NPDC057577 TaxID=3346171 RepID=UPI00366C0087
MGGAQPRRVGDLIRSTTVLAAERGISQKRLVALVANVVLAQMLPAAAVKGGTGLKLRFGERLTRETPDVDAAYRGDLDVFRDELADRLGVGWHGFTGEVTMGERRAPESVPAAYVMQPFRVRLEFARKTFKAIDLEIGYDELEATTNEPPEMVMSSEVLDIFDALGLPEPAAVRVQPLPHQIAQKIHACTAPRSQRAHDLVDLQLIVPATDPKLVATVTERLFAFRQEHDWPPLLSPGARWDSLYEEAAEGLDVLASVSEAVVWLNDYIAELGLAEGETRRAGPSEGPQPA